jgi:hypothetical protein
MRRQVHPNQEGIIKEIPRIGSGFAASAAR